jgi:GNAT superfamily N-acetyltransferase
MSRLDSVVQLRGGTIADLPRVLDLLVMLHTETPHARLSLSRLEEGALECLQSGIVILSTTLAGEVVGTLGLCIETPWFSEEEWLCDRWMFVHPAHRRTPHARTLLDAAKRLAEEQGYRLQMAVTGYGPRTAGKVRLFSRVLGEPTGAIWHVRGAA